MAFLAAIKNLLRNGLWAGSFSRLFKAFGKIHTLSRFEVGASRAPTWKIYRAHHFIGVPAIRALFTGHSVDRDLANHKGTVMQLISREPCSKIWEPGLSSKSSTVFHHLMLEIVSEVPASKWIRIVNNFQKYDDVQDNICTLTRDVALI